MAEQGKIAMVGTPCHMIAAAKMEKYSDYLGASTVDIKIGLFCMENFSYSYMKKLLEKHNVNIKDVTECRVEKGYAWFFLKDNDVLKIPLDEAKTCARKNCNICMDFTSELSDVSVGSVGSPEGWSTVIVRSDKGLNLLKDAEENNYIKTKPLSESGLKILENLSKKKKKENRKEINKREKVARPVLYRRPMFDEDFKEEVSKCQFKDLKGDVIDIGACVLCGACYYTCPESIISIEDRKPQLRGKCPEGCNLCYVACPRTYITDDILSKENDKKAIGDYIKIVSAKAPMIHGQDGGVVTALLNYALSKKLVDKAVVVDSGLEPWKPEAKLTDNIAEVLSASGTKYSACPVFKSLKNREEI